MVRPGQKLRYGSLGKSRVGDFRDMRDWGW